MYFTSDSMLPENQQPFIISEAKWDIAPDRTRPRIMRKPMLRHVLSAMMYGTYRQVPAGASLGQASSSPCRS